jgi:hypothetical protein
VIKRRQVLVNFDKTINSNLDISDETTLSRKNLDALNTTWAATDEPKPQLPKLKSTILP